MDDSALVSGSTDLAEGTKVYILLKAVTKRRVPFCRAPLFMKGGFDSWYERYPDYTVIAQPEESGGVRFDFKRENTMRRKVKAKMNADAKEEPGTTG